MKLTNLLIRELENCSLGAIFESRAVPKFVNLIAFLWKLISKEHVVVIIEFPDWVQVEMKIPLLAIWINLLPSQHQVLSCVTLIGQKLEFTCDKNLHIFRELLQIFHENM